MNVRRIFTTLSYLGVVEPERVDVGGYCQFRVGVISDIES